MFKLMKWIVYLFLAMLFLGWIVSFFDEGNESDKPLSVKKSPAKDSAIRVIPEMILACRYNPGAPYEDVFSFYADGTIIRTSTNKNTETEKYSFQRRENDIVLLGTKTVTSIDGVTTKYPDSELFIARESNRPKWNWGVFYFEDYDTDPLELYVCTKT